MTIIPFLYKALDVTGVPLIGGKLYTYEADGVTPKATYTDASGNFSASNPLILNVYGQVLIFADSGVLHVNLTDSHNTQMPYYPASITVPTTIGQTGITGIQGASGVFAVQDYSATANQTIFIVTAGYIPGINGVAVFQNGVRLISGIDYTETDINTITLTTGADLGDLISVSSSEGISAFITSVLFQTTLASGVAPNSLFVDSTDNILKFKNSVGTVKEISLI